MAIKVGAKATMEAITRGKRFLFVLQSCSLYTLFILYRGCRGFAIILPSLFRQWYTRLLGVIETPFDDDEEEEGVKSSVDGGGMIHGRGGTVSWQSRITVFVLTWFLILSYILHGALRVGGTLVQTMLQTNSVTGSFLQAANEQEANEARLTRLTERLAKRQTIPSTGM